MCVCVCVRACACVRARVDVGVCGWMGAVDTFSQLSRLNSSGVVVTRTSLTQHLRVLENNANSTFEYYSNCQARMEHGRTLATALSGLNTTKFCNLNY